MGLGRLGPTCQRLLSSLVDGSSSSRPSAHGASRLDRVLRGSNAGVVGGLRSAGPGIDVEVSSSQCASIHNSRWTAWSARRELEDGLRLQSNGCIWSKFCRSVNTSAGACDIRGPVALYRYGQLRGFASGFRGQGGRIDIGARARQNQARRLWTIAISGTLVAGFIIVVLNTFQENMMFYITPSQALEKYFLDPSKNRFRLGGLVLEGSVHHSKTAAEMEFVVTDLANEILVRYRGALPDLFREGHSVVAEGFLRPIDSYPGRPDASNDLTSELAEKAKQAGCYFTAVEVLAKHDEKYMPKEVAVAIEKNKAAQEAQQLALSGAMSGALTAQLPVSPESPPPSGGQKRKGVSQTPVIAQQYELPS